MTRDNVIAVIGDLRDYYRELTHETSHPWADKKYNLINQLWKKENHFGQISRLKLPGSRNRRQVLPILKDYENQGVLNNVRHYRKTTA